MTVRILIGDCLDVLPTLAPATVDVVVTDPPYGLSFMGRAWDHGVPGVPFWEAALAATKPGAYLLAFGGTRTFHRLACAIEDAGWEVQDCLSWLYGSGFPKHKSKLKPAWEPIILARTPAPRATPLQVDACRIGTEERSAAFTSLAPCANNAIGAAGTQEARRGTQGEPRAYVGRWPANVVLDGDAAAALDAQAPDAGASVGDGQSALAYVREHAPYGFDARGGASRFFYCAKASRAEREAGLTGPQRADGSLRLRTAAHAQRTGEAAQPGRNHHPTVKPVALMRWLVRLVTPPGGLVLDPFTGSGTTGIACALEGFRFLGIEREAEYAEIARARIAHAAAQPSLFDVDGAA